MRLSQLLERLLGRGEEDPLKREIEEMRRLAKRAVGKAARVGRGKPRSGLVSRARELEAEDIFPEELVSEQ